MLSAGRSHSLLAALQPTLDNHLYACAARSGHGPVWICQGHEKATGRKTAFFDLERVCRQLVHFRLSHVYRWSCSLPGALRQGEPDTVGVIPLAGEARETHEEGKTNRKSQYRPTPQSSMRVPRDLSH